MIPTIKDHLSNKEWLAKNLPSEPGIYQIFDKDQTLIYIGKAKNLRRRLMQYKNAKRTKKHWKMRALVKEGHELKVLVCATEVEAALREVEWIQRHRPKYNVEAAYFFLYPSLFARVHEDQLEIAFSTSESAFAGWSRFGCYRSREFTKDSFYSLRELLGFVGHLKSLNKTRMALPKYSMGFSVRQIQEVEMLFTALGKFLRGESLEFLESLSLELVERVSARAEAEHVQIELRNLRRFFYFEAKPLKKICDHFDKPQPLAQLDRDPLWRKFRYEGSDSKS